TDLKNNPGMIAVDSVSTDRKIRSILNKAIAAGFLHSGSKLGVYVEDCPYDERAYDRNLTPIVTQHHITVFREDTSCFNGYSDEGEQQSTLDAAVLKFRSEGVDTVMF